MKTIKFRGVNDDKTLVYPDKHLFRGLNSGDILQRFSNVEQFTGLQDSKGKDIYEGDILNTETTFENNMADERYQEHTVIIVGFKNGCFIDENTDVNLFNKIKSIVSRKIDFEILGNIHETPELL